MLRIFVGIIVRVAIVAGVAFILPLTSLPQSKLARFAFLFILGIPLNLIINYVNVWGFGYHRMGWTGAAVIALLLAAFGTFLLPQSHDPNTT